MHYGPENIETNSESARQRELLAELLSQTSDSDIYPASLAQQRLWFLDEMQGGCSAYNVHLGLWLRGPLVLDALRSALQAIVDRHDTLRTSFKLEGHELQQIVQRRIVLTVPVDDVTHSPEPYVEAYRLAQREVEAQFVLSNAPLFRARVIRVTPDDHVLLCTMHHIVTDAWSMQIMARELEAVYVAFSNGEPSPLADLPIGYGDYSEWQQRWLGTDKVQQEVDYWKTQLNGAPPLLELPNKGPRPPEQTFEGASHTVPIPADVMASTKQLAAAWQTTPFVVFLAAFKILLYRYSGQPDLLVGVPVAGRNRMETEGLIGFFVNTLVLRDNLSHNPEFIELVAQVRTTALDGFANADVPFEKVVEVLKPERSLSYNPIFQVMFSVIKAAVQSHNFGNLTAFPYIVTPTSAIVDLFASVIEGVDGQWWVQLDYRTNLFDGEAIAEMLKNYTSMIQTLVTRPQTRILDVPMEGVECHRPLPASPALLAPKVSKPHPTSALNGNYAIQQRLLEIWREVLGVTGIGIHDNFFDVGGHSLLAARLMAEIERATGRRIRVSAVFRAPTIAEFARLLEDESIAQPDPVVMRLGQGGTATPLFAVATPGVDTLGFAQLAHRLSPLHSVFKLQASAPLISGRPFSDAELDALAAEYLAAMRSIQPRGPYCFASMCEGVLVAQKMILQLESEGEEVAFFAILDTWVMENTQIKSLWALDYYVQRFRYWRSRPIDQQVATVRRMISRKISSQNKGNGSGWEKAFWPGEGFQAARFRAPVLLFKRPRQPYYHLRDPQMGWGGRSLGGVEICEIQCGHVEMLREPFVRVVSQKLKNRLQMISLSDRDSQLGSEAGCNPVLIDTSQADWNGSAA